MLGRGMLLNPLLGQSIATELGIPNTTNRAHLTPEAWKNLFLKMFELGAQYGDSQITVLRRVKQWLSMRNLKQPTPCFDVIKRLQTPEEFFDLARDPNIFQMDTDKSFAPH